MTFCDLISAMALTALLMVLLPRLLDTLITGAFEQLLARFCSRLCRLWILLAFLFGTTLGVLIWSCGSELARLVLDGGCRQLITFGFLWLLAALFFWLCWVGRCGVPRIADFLAWDLLLGFLALALWWVIRQCCGDAAATTASTSSVPAGATAAGPSLSACGRWVIAALILLVLTGAARYLACRLCGDRDSRGCAVWPRYLTWLVAFLLASLIALVLRCCDELHEEHELAMVGIWWTGDYQGEEGAHLRWGFEYGTLPFPDGGFDLERRVSGSGDPWVALNGDRIRPALEWGDEGAVTGDMWRGEGVERLHPDAWDQLRGVPFDDLVAMVLRDPYAPLYFIEEPDPAEFATPPANPYDSEADRNAYLGSYYAEGTNEDPMRPLAVWTWEPMTAIQTMALFPEIARLVGLYYLDRTADPEIEYDYRVVGYWPDRERTYVVEGLSRPNTAPLQPPVITRADSPVEIGTLDGGVTLIDDQAVGLAWTPPSLDPDDLAGPLDRIDSIVFHVQNKPLQGMGAPPSCPESTDGTGFLPARRPTGVGDLFEDMPPVTVSPEEDASTGDLTWPEHYFFHRDLPYGCYAYRVEGRDIFGRPSPVSAPRILPVHDLTPPPPPFFVQANVYQRADTSLSQAIRDTYLPEGSDNTFALVVSWVWTDQMLERADDVEEFLVHLRHTDHANFVDVDGPPIWRDAAYWDLEILPRTGFLDFGPLPARFTALPTPISGRYYERVFTDADISAADAGLDAGDTEPVAYTWVGVSAIDHAPYSNAGEVSAPVLAMAPDLVPPDPPDPPALVGAPGPADTSGNRGLRLAWPGQAIYDYQLHRVDVANLGTITTVPDEALPACLAGERPACDPGVDGDSCVAAHEDFDIRSTAALDPGRFLRISPLPIEAVGGEAASSDKVDATSSRRYLYAAAAIDAAANVSGLSCPSDVILIPDGVAPRPPVWTTVTGADGQVELVWAVNPEDDLAEYTVYRTTTSANAISRKRMVELARLRDDGSPISGAPAADVTNTGTYDTVTWFDEQAVPGQRYHYRLDAVDAGGNRSELSGVTSARAFDATPPLPPVWAAPAATVGDGTITLHWQLDPADAEIQVLVQRRRQGTLAWSSRGGWRPAGATDAADDVADDATYEYRLRAMDPSGNRGTGFSSVETVVVP